MSASEVAALDAIGISVRYGERQVLADVTLRIACGTCTALIGPNGCGKSTLLRVCAGLEHAPGALVQTLGQDVTLLTPRGRAGLLAYGGSHAGALAGSADGMPMSSSAASPGGLSRSRYALLPAAAGLSVAQFVALGAVSQQGEGDLPHATEFALRRVALEPRAREAIGVLSAGQQQLAAVARLLVQLTAHRPGPLARMIILDEPTSALDPHHIALVTSVLAELCSRGAGVLLATHDLQLAACCSHVSLLGPSQACQQRAQAAQAPQAASLLVASGTPSEILTAALLGDLFNAEFVAPGERRRDGALTAPVARYARIGAPLPAALA